MTTYQLTGTMCCPVCGTDSPHSHSREEIQAWVTQIVTAWGYKAVVYVSVDPRNLFVQEALKTLKEEKSGWESYPRGFSTVSFYEAPLLTLAIDAIEGQAVVVDLLKQEIESLGGNVDHLIQ